MNILVLRYRFIGDTILTVPFLRNLRRAYPDGKIDMVVAPHSSDVLIGTPYVDEFIIYDPPTIHADSRGTHKTITSKIAFISSLRGRGYDKAYVLKRSFSSALIAYLTGARERIGFETEKRGFLLTRRVPYRHDRHEIVNFLRVLEADGVTVADDYLEAWVSEEEMAWAEDFLSESGITSGQGIVGIHPFSAVAERAWHEDNFIEVANYLAKNRGIRIILFGGSGDVAPAGHFQENLDPPPVNAVGKTKLRQTMALLKHCSFLICNDSGIMHLGAALNVPLIALFGPQSPVKFGPWGERSTVVYKNFFCSPCRQIFFEECDPSPRMKPMCMEEITPHEIIELAENLLRDQDMEKQSGK